MSNFQIALIVFDGILVASFSVCYVMAIISLIKAKISK